ncbi:unnamed protein product [Fraxinus pennsylvanica]|uniref:Uncharacterized protein n=1 Tax=Fraxinus pennsylvanica TaxID=56036 RepID=A0AAD2AE74_9LAMI|nr:unnamed protein product [Fraxinus pennsylvanica]
MSTISSLVLVLFLLFFPFHGCRARSIGVFNNEPVEVFLSSSKNNKASGLVRVSIQPDSKASEATKPESKNHEEKIDDDKMSPATSVVAPNRKSLQKVEVLDTVETEPAVSVSWRVPHKKRGEEEPWFNLDYLPPKTHPPHNN